MRRALSLSLLLFVLSAAGLCFAHAEVNKARNQVYFTETASYGDKSAAKGAMLQLSTHYDRHLFWNTSYTFGDTPTVDTAFRFSARGAYDNPPIRYRGVHFDSYSNVYVFTDGGSPPDMEDAGYTGLSAAYAELFADTPPGGQRSKVIRLGDYYDYYPLAVTVDLPGFRMDQSAAMGVPLGGPENPNPELLAVFADFFRIPILQDEQIEIHASKGADGNSFGYGGGPVGQSYYTGTSSVVADNACYFTFGIHRGDGETVDTSLIPGGYGIYCLPYEAGSGEKDSPTRVDADGLRMVYPMSRESELLELGINPERTKLLLHTAEDGKYIITVIDIATMRALQRLEVLDRPKNSFWRIYEGDGFLTAIVYEEGMAVLTVTDEGFYELRLKVNLDSDEKLIYGYPMWDDVMDYDGNRLMAAGFLRHEEHQYPICGFYTAVYDKSGLIYYGEYESSLDTGITQEGHRYSYSCMPIDHSPMTVILR